MYVSLILCMLDMDLFLLLMVCLTPVFNGAYGIFGFWFFQIACSDFVYYWWKYTVYEIFVSSTFLFHS